MTGFEAQQRLAIVSSLTRNVAMCRLQDALY
jgi:hypothetical protein